MSDDDAVQPTASTGATSATTDRRTRPPWWWAALAVLVVAAVVAVAVRYATDDTDTAPTVQGSAVPLVTETSGANPTASSPTEPPATSPAPDTSVDAAAWQRRDSINTPRDDFGTAVVDDKIWITGGMTGGRGNKLNSTEIYDPATDTWSFGPTMPTARSSLTTVAIDGTIFAMGGARADTPILDIVEALDTATGTWTRLAPMPTGRYEHGSVVLDGKIWVIGGTAASGKEGAGEYSATVDIFDPATGTWTAGPSMANPRSAMRTAVLDGKIYAVGGLADDGLQDVVEVYDPAVGAWQPGPPLPEKILNFGLTAYDGALHAIYHRHHFVLGPDDTAWQDEGAPPVIRHGLGLTELDGLLYAIGGCTEEPLLDVNAVLVWQG